MRTESFHLGGYDPVAPNRNRAELLDPDTATYTRYHPDGTVAETRPLTADEIAALTPPPPPPPSAEERLAAIRQALTDMEAPYLPADIVDILSTALEA